MPAVSDKKKREMHAAKKGKAGMKKMADKYGSEYKKGAKPKRKAKMTYDSKMRK